MIKKYIPFVIVLLAAALLLWIKSNQRGNKQAVENYPVQSEPFIRDTSIIEYSKHALCRMGCRQIDEEEIKDILLTGKINTRKIEEDEKGMTYPLEGITKDQQHVRIVFAPKKEEIVVVTVIDLEKDWTCDCN